ncbi:MAG: M15 family metallopeptidase [Hydrotalea sp.]|nr:M15 family metallopeptidase [Hydrotalea sp.]
MHLITDIAQLTPRLQALESMLRAFARQNNIDYAITETYRTMATIADYYAVGRRGVAGEKIITHVSPDNAAMKSPHYNRCAFDIVLIGAGGKRTYEPLATFGTLGEYWESLDPLCTWGGNWQTLKDNPHFEHRAYQQSRPRRGEVS